MSKTALAVMLLLTASPAWAQQPYRWIDRDGGTHYSNTPPNHLPYSARPAQPAARPPRLSAEDRATLDQLDRRIQRLALPPGAVTERRQAIREAEARKADIHRKYGLPPRTPEGAANPPPAGALVETQDGAIDPVTGKFYPSAGAGAIRDPVTGKIYPAAGPQGFIDPDTGKLYPKAAAQTPEEPPLE